MEHSCSGHTELHREKTKKNFACWVSGGVRYSGPAYPNSAFTVIIGGLSHQTHDVCFIPIFAYHHPLHPSLIQPLAIWHCLALLVTRWSLIPDGRCGYSGFDLGLRQYVRLHPSRHRPQHTPTIDALPWDRPVSHNRGLDALISKKREREKRKLSWNN